VASADSVAGRPGAPASPSDPSDSNHSICEGSTPCCSSTRAARRQMAKDGSIEMRFMLTRRGCAHRDACTYAAELLYGYTVCAKAQAWIKSAGSSRCNNGRTSLQLGQRHVRRPVTKERPFRGNQGSANRRALHKPRSY
jgi:hypothetical protein